MAAPLCSLRERRRREGLARRRAGALAGASAVFAVKGFHDAQMSEIAAAAELSRSSLYAIFESQEQNQDLLRSYAHGTQGLPWKIREAMGESSLQIFQSFTGWVIEVAKRAQRVGCLRGLDAETVAVSPLGTVTTTAARCIEQPPGRPLSPAAAKIRSAFDPRLASAGRG